MDTSIVILIIIGVLVFALPSLVKGVAKAGDADMVPPSARDPRTGSRTHCDGQASQPHTLLTGELADIPEAGVPLATQPPSISLRRPEPELTVLAGGLDTEELAHEEAHDHVYLAPASGMESVAVSHRPLDIRMTAHTPKPQTPQSHGSKPHTPQPHAAKLHSAKTTGKPAGGKTPVKGTPAKATKPTVIKAEAAPRQGGVSAPGQHETNKLKRLLALGFMGLFVVAVVTGAFSIFGPLSFAAPVLTLAASLACLTGVVALNSVNEPASVEASAEVSRGGGKVSAEKARGAQKVRAEKATPVARESAAKPRVAVAGAITSEIPVVKDQARDTAQSKATEPRPAEPKQDGTRDSEQTEKHTVAQNSPSSTDQSLSVKEASEAPELHLGEKFEELSQGKGWFPKDMPVPTYVTKAHAEQATTSGKVEAAQTSYGVSPSDREELARAFAAEVGARPELEDAAKDSAALRHGKAAIRSDKKLANDNARAVVDDVLARRRA